MSSFKRKFFKIYLALILFQVSHLSEKCRSHPWCQHLIYALSQAFNDADLLPTSNQEVRALLEADPGGRVEPGADNVTRFRTSGGLLYDFRHGRNRCVPDMCMLVTQDKMPHNCGYHRQWYRPYNFQICGPRCPGSFCNCMEYYWTVVFIF